MEFEWDDVKSEANFAKHGFDFEHATQIFEGPVRQYVDRRPWGEAWRDRGDRDFGIAFPPVTREMSGSPNFAALSRRSASYRAASAGATPQQREAKPYQIAQFIEIVEEFELKMDGEQ